MKTPPIAVLLLALTACSPAASPTPELQAISGSLIFFNGGEHVDRADDNQTEADYFCGGTDGYEDLASDAAVVMRDAADTMVAATRLHSTHSVEPTDDDRVAIRALGWDPDDEDFLGLWNLLFCRFVWETTMPAPASDFYTLTIGDQDPLTYTRVELEGLDWKLALTIGG